MRQYYGSGDHRKLFTNYYRSYYINKKGRRKSSRETSLPSDIRELWRSSDTIHRNGPDLFCTFVLVPVPTNGKHEYVKQGVKT